MAQRSPRIALSWAACAVAAACASAAPPAKPASPAIARGVAPASSPEPAVELRLPVEGVWIVSQGYHGSETHRGHAAYALDLVKLGDDGRAYRGRGRRLEDWHSFGAEVLASADGIVARARDHVPDNRVMGRGKDTNSVIVQHGDVYSEYVHLQRGSLRVRAGDPVVRGQVLARAGNSGAQTPHLHWALLSSLEPIRTRPAVLDYEAMDGSGVFGPMRGVPSTGATVRPRGPAH